LILVDTGVFVAAALPDDDFHHQCVELLLVARATNQKLVVPATVLAEAGYMIERVLGPKGEAEFLDSLLQDDFIIAEITKGDIARMRELILKYADLGLGTTDASVVAIAERFKITNIATIDRNHFSIVKPNHISYFTLLPEI